jgi:hypothetical protein
MSKPRPTANHSRQSRACALAPHATSDEAVQSAELLAQAGLEALTASFPGWRIWRDDEEWHARRRSDGFVQDYRPGAPAFHVSADTAIDLAAQLCWQHAAERHAPGGCDSSGRVSKQPQLAAAGAW